MFLLGYGFFKILIYRPTWYQLFSYLNLPPQKTKVAYEIQIEQILTESCTIFVTVYIRYSKSDKTEISQMLSSWSTETRVTYLNRKKSSNKTMASTATTATATPTPIAAEL